MFSRSLSGIYIFPKEKMFLRTLFEDILLMLLKDIILEKGRFQGPYKEYIDISQGKYASKDPFWRYFSNGFRGYFHGEWTLSRIWIFPKENMLVRTLLGDIFVMLLKKLLLEFLKTYVKVCLFRKPS